MRNLDTTNLQSIEVLKGPAAMLFGRVRARRHRRSRRQAPARDALLFGAAAGRILSAATRTTVDATGPLTQDKSLLYRVNGEFYRTDSYRDFVTDRNVFVAPTITLSSDRAVPAEHRLRISEQDLGRRLSHAAGGRRQAPPIFRSAAISQSAFTHDGIARSISTRKRIAYDWTYEFLPDWSLTNRLSYTSIGHPERQCRSVRLQSDDRRAQSLRITSSPGRRIGPSRPISISKASSSTGPHRAIRSWSASTHSTTICRSTSPISRSLSSINIYAPNYWQVENPYQQSDISASRRKNGPASTART